MISGLPEEKNTAKTTSFAGRGCFVQRAVATLLLALKMQNAIEELVHRDALRSSKQMRDGGGLRTGGSPCIVEETQEGGHMVFTTSVECA